MKFKQSLLDSVKGNSIRREVTFIIADSSKNRKIKREICNQFENINKNLRYRLDKIAKLTRLIPKKIITSFTSPYSPVFDNDINDFFNIIVDASILRVLINYDDFDTNSLNDIIISRDDISH